MHHIKLALKSLKSATGDFTQDLDLLLHDFMNHAECMWDFRSIRYSAVMNNSEWTDFVTHPERVPYQSTYLSKLSEKEQLAEIFKILGEVYKYYLSLKKSAVKETLKSNITSLLDYALNAYYDTELMRFEDAYIGRTSEDRDNGIVEPTQVSLAHLDYAIKEYSFINNIDEKEFRKKIYSLCGGRFGILTEIYSTCNIDKSLRDEIDGLLDILSRNKTLVFFDIKVGWEIWKILRGMGIDLDAYLKLNGFPSYNIIKSRLLAFQSNKTFIAEALNHFKDEYPESYKLYAKQGFVYRRNLVHEEARRKQYPTSLRSDKDIQKMISECTKEIYGYFPMAEKLSPRNVLLNPVHPASTRRAFQSSVRNANGDRVNTIVMTPRVDHKDDYLPTFAHEVTHALHRMILEKGEKAGILEKGSSESIPSAVMEDFSQLVEEQFHVDRDLPYKKKFKGSEFPNFTSALTIRFQVPFALAQLTVRKEFDKLWNSGVRAPLTEEQLWSMKTKLDAAVKSWHELGIKIVSPGMTAFGLFNSYNPDDGLVYMKRYFVKMRSKNSKLKNQPKDKKNIINMPDALKKRFGPEWVKNSDARTLVLWLLLETGRNHATETFGELILSKSIAECEKELAKL